VLFQTFTSRHEHASITVTSNLPDLIRRRRAAMIDRLVRHTEVLTCQESPTSFEPAANFLAKDRYD
jgi:hypothetical protein